MNYQELRSNWVKARKEKDLTAVAVLGGIVDKIQKLAKSNNSEDFDAYVKQAIMSENKAYLDAKEQGMQVDDMINYISELLPKFKTAEETRELIQQFKESFDETRKLNMGEIMQFLKTQDDIDMKIASGIAKEFV